MPLLQELVPVLGDKEYEKALDERGLTRIRFREDVERLRHWVDRQPHLPHNLEDEILESFIWGTKSMAKAQKKLDNYFWCRASMTETLKDRDPADPQYQIYNNKTLQFFLPRLSPKGCRVFMTVLSGEDAHEDFEYSVYSRRTNMLLDVVMSSGGMARVTADIFLADCRHVTPQFVLKLLPRVVTNNLTYYQKALPTRDQKVILFNMHSISEKLLNYVFKPLLSNKLIDRIYATSRDHTCLKEFFTLEMLPKDYGGLELSCQELHDKWTELLIEWRPWFLGAGGTRCSDEKLRLTDGKNRPGQDSVQGTFRNLDID